MPTIDDLLGPAPVARRESIADLLGPESPPVSYFKPERADTPADFLDERTAWKGPRGFQSTKPTKREELEAERDTTVDTVSLDKLTGQAAVGGRYGSVGGLKKTLAGVLRAVNAPPILTWLWSKSAEQDEEDAAKFGEMIGGGKSGRTAQEFGSTAVQSLPALAAAPAGLLGIAVTAGAQTFGSVTEDAYQTYKAKEDPDALSKARLAGGLAGVVTAGLTRYMPGGTERFAQALARGELNKLAAQGVIKTILKEAAKEFPEEALDQVSQGIIAKLSYRPETTWQNIADDSLKAGLMGSALAGFTGTAVLPAVKAVSSLRRGSSLRESISTDEPQQQYLETPIERGIPEATPTVDQLLGKEAIPVEETQGKGQRSVPIAPISPEPAAAEVSSTTVAASQVGVPSLVPVLVTADGKTYSGTSHADALARALVDVKAGKITGDEFSAVGDAMAVDAQHQFLDTATSKVMTRAEAAKAIGVKGELQSEQLNPAQVREALKIQVAFGKGQRVLILGAKSDKPYGFGIVDSVKSDGSVIVIADKTQRELSVRPDRLRNAEKANPITKPAEVSSKLVSGGKGTRAAVAEFTALVKEYGEQLGWIQNFDAIVGISGAKTGHSTTSVKADIKGNTELATARRKAITDLGGNAQKATPADIATLLPKLKERIAQYESSERSHETGVGETVPEFPPADRPATVPKLAPGEKGTGDLFKGEDQPFNLAGERGVDFERVAAEKERAEQARKEAESATAKQQQELLGTKPAPAVVNVDASFPRPLAQRLLALSREAQTSGYGPQNEALRQDVLEAITGTRPPKSKSGAKATETALGKHFGLDMENMAGIEIEDGIRAKLKEITSTTQVSQPAPNDTAAPEGAVPPTPKFQSEILSKRAEIEARTRSAVRDKNGKIATGTSDEHHSDIMDRLWESDRLEGARSKSRRTDTGWVYGNDQSSFVSIEDVQRHNGDVTAAIQEKLSAPKTGAEILSTVRKVKVKAPEGATQIRVTDKSGKFAVQPLASVNTANPFIGVDIATIAAGTIDKGGKFKAMAGDVAVTDVDAAKAAKTFSEQANAIAEKLEGIKSGRRPGDVQAFGVIPAVWDAAISIAQGIIRAGGTVADAIKAALDHIRASNNAPFDEAGAAGFIDSLAKPNTAYEELIDPNESTPANDAGLEVNIAGRTYPVISKDKLTPEQRAAGDARAQSKFKELGIPGAPDTTIARRAGSIDNNTVFRVVPDGVIHDEAAIALRDHLVEQIQMQNSLGGDSAYVSSLVNAINMSFDLGRWRGVVSQPVLESLLNVSVGYSSRIGMLLRQIRGISNDIRAVAQNAALRLKWVYAEAFDPDGVGRETLRKVQEAVRATADTPEAREAALKQVLASLDPKKRAKVQGTPLGKKIEKLVKAGGFDDAELFRAFAKEHRWKVPTDKELEQMREWANREEALRTPTPEQITKLGGNADTARTIVEAATIDTRKELLRKMNTQWSQWTQPLVTNWRDLFDPEKVKNTNMAFNEWVAANLLLKIGFGTRQIIDVGTQMGLNTPTRALARAWEAWRNDVTDGRDSSLQHSIAEAFADAYRTRLKVLGYALNSFKQTLKGKGEQRQVEQLISSIGIFDRALMNAARMRAEGKRGAANLLEVIVIGMRMGRQFAAAMDIVHGIPAEAQEIAHQVRNALREKGLGTVAVDVQFNSIMNILTAQRAEAITLARELLEQAGEDTSSAAVERAAWHILREKIYNSAQQSGMPVDEWKAHNKLYRDLIGWNLSETKGMQGVGGPGGLVALTGKAAKEMLSKVPLVGGVLSVPFTFTNAMGISMNRKLAWTPLGFFPGIFKGSPHWEGETNIRQRKIEAAIGTGIQAVLFLLILSGVWKALPAFWPKDDKERDKWVRNGWSPGMVIIPWGNNQELHLSTRTGPLAFFAPSIAAAAAYTQKTEERAKRQAVINERAKKLGIQPEQLEGLSMVDWMGIMGGAAWSSVAGGRTASGAISAYTDYGTFNVRKAAASVTGAILPGFPALNEFGRLAGANINPKFASFWDMLVPLPTSNAQRVNMLGDPMRDENDYRRIFTILSGGNFPFPTSATPAETDAYAALFGSDYRPPSINPSRGYNINGKLRPLTADELQKYTVLRGQEFKQALSGLGSNPSTEAVKAAFVDANGRALASVGVAIPKQSTVLARTPSRRRTNRLRGGRSRRFRGFSRSRLRSRLGTRRRRLGVLR